MEASKLEETVSGSTKFIPVWESKLIWDIEQFQTMWSDQRYYLSSAYTVIENQHLNKNLEWGLSMQNDAQDQESIKLIISLRGKDSHYIDYCSYNIVIGKPGVNPETPSERLVSDTARKEKPQTSYMVVPPYHMICTLQSKIRRDDLNFYEAKIVDYTLRVTVNMKILLKPVDKPGVRQFPLIKRGIPPREKWIANLFNNERLSDVVIRCRGAKYLGHKIVLGQSSVFEKMFTTNMKEARTNEIGISDTDPVVFECFLKSMYGVDFELPNELPDILQLVNCAEKYDMIHLKLSCFEKLAGMLSDENAAELTIAAFQFCKEEELRETRNYFRQYCLE